MRSTIGKRPQLRRIDYKVAGQGKQAAVAGFDPELCPDPETFLTERLGKLAWFRVEDAPEPPDPDPPPAPEPEPPQPPGRWSTFEADASPYPDMGQPSDDQWRVPDWALELDEQKLRGGAPESGFSGQYPPAREAESELSCRRDNLTCDVPWLHVETPARLAPDGTVLVPECPYCGEQHRHRGFGHRLAHCADPRGRGYVLRHAGQAPMSGGSVPLGP